MDFKQASEIRYNIKPVPTHCAPMEYSNKRGKITLIAIGHYQGLNYYVKNIGGTHPTSYIEIPQGHKAYGSKKLTESYCEDDALDVHGGITYTENHLGLVDDKGERCHEFVGWDYGHAGDFAGYWIGNPRENDDYIKKMKRWTTDEIVEECKRGIEQINEIKG